MTLGGYAKSFFIHLIEDPTHHIIMSRPLGATLVEVFMSIRQLQVPGCCKHDNPALGGYIIWSIQFLLSDWDEQHGFLLKWQYLY